MFRCFHRLRPLDFSLRVHDVFAIFAFGTIYFAMLSLILSHLRGLCDISFVIFARFIIVGRSLSASPSLSGDSVWPVTLVARHVV